MAAKELKKATESLACPVCFQVFRNPKFLSCYHSYCEDCLEKMQKQSRITCPECRKETVIPAGGVKELPNNFFINRLVDEFIPKCTVDSEEEVNCEKCDEDDPVVSYCPDCSLFLCKVCNDAHKRDKSSRAHGVVPLSKLRSSKDTPSLAKVNVPTCKDHDYELKHYCETCEELICLYCTLKEHSDHSHDTVKKMAEKHRSELQSYTALVEEMIEGLSDAHINIDRMKMKVKQQGNEVDKKIDCWYDALIQSLKQQKEQLKQQAHDAVSQKEKVLIAQLEEVECAQAEVFSIKELKDAVESSSDQELLLAKKQIIDCTQEITDKYNKLNVQPLQSATMEFISVVESFPQFGTVLTHVDPSATEVDNLPRHITAGKKVEFSIITKYCDGIHCSVGGSEVSALLESDTGEVRHAQVWDNDDGSYTACFVAEQAGNTKLFVSINGQQINGSPYSLVVQCMDYTRVNWSNKMINNEGSMSRPWGVAFNNNGMWVVADSCEPYVYVYDNHDQLIYSFGDQEQFKSLAAITIDEDNHIYLTDRCDQSVRKFDIDGTYLLPFDGQSAGLHDPVGITTHDDRVYVADYRCNRVFVFQTNGQFLRAFGEGWIRGPYDVAVSTNSFLLVASWTKGCIYQFTLDGSYISKFGETGSCRGLLCNPSSLIADPGGFILVVEFSNNRVSIFDKTGKFVHCFGSAGNDNGQFHHPLGIALAPNGNIYISDADNKRIQIFSV